MLHKNQDIADRMQQFQRICRQSQVKLTPQRMEIFAEVVRSHDHPDAETVFTRVRQRIPSLSLDTVYRTLWLLDDLQLISTLGAHHERTRFDANLTPHHHFVCKRCGVIRDFTSQEIDEMTLPTQAKSFGQIDTLQLEARGICRQCAEHEA